MYTEYGQDFTGREFHDRLYRGGIIRLRGVRGMQQLAAFAQDFLERFLAPHPPVESHRHHDEQALAEVFLAAQREFAKSRQAQRLWQAVFEHAGLDPAQTARDRIILRFQPPDPPGRERAWSRSTSTVGFHRDTWGTNLYAQVNWWAPVYPIDASRTFAFFPEKFAQPIANDSADFDLAEVMRRLREAPGTMKAGQMTPRPLETFDASAGQPVVIEVGEVIAFSAQHAHVGVRNRTPFTRISMDTRTLFIPDHVAGRGAPNVDGLARWRAPGMFRRISDGVSLAQLLGTTDLEPHVFTAPGGPEAGRR